MSHIVVTHYDVYFVWVGGGRGGMIIFMHTCSGMKGPLNVLKSHQPMYDLCFIIHIIVYLSRILSFYKILRKSCYSDCFLIVT